MHNQSSNCGDCDVKQKEADNECSGMDVDQEDTAFNVAHYLAIGATFLFLLVIFMERY